MAAKAHADAQRGFTLLEMMISVSLLALIITLAYGSIRVATRSTRSGEALIARSEELRSTQVFLRRQLGQIMTIPYERLDDNGEEKRFDGAADKVTFVAPMPGYLSRGGAHVQMLELVSGARGTELRFRNAQLNGFDAREGIPDDPPPVVLLDGIDSARFQFRQMQGDGQLGDWSDDFDPEFGMPVLIRLDIEFDRDDPRHWPEFIVAMQSASSSPMVGFSRLRPPGAPNLPNRPESQ